ncbi:MAG: ABC transporter ATP-binding protein [Desulfobacter sp.]
MTSNYTKLKYLLGKDRNRFYLLVIAVVLQALLDIAMLITLAPFLSMLMNPKAVEIPGQLLSLLANVGLHHPKECLTVVGIAVFFIYVTAGLYSLLINWVIIRFSLKQGCNISTKLFKSYLSRNYLFFLKHNTSELSRVIFQDVARFTDNVLTPFLTLSSRIISAIAIIVLLSFVNLTITAIAILVFSICYVFIYFKIRIFLINSAKLFCYYNNHRFRNVSEAFNGIKDCKIYGIEPFYINNYQHNTYYDSVTQTKRRTLLILPKYIMECVAIGGMLLFSVLMYNNGGSTELVTTITIFAIAAYRLMPYLQNIYSDVSQIRSNINALDVIYDNFLTLKADGTSPKPASVVSFRRSLEIAALEYSYPGTDSSALKNVNLAIKPYSIVGIAGASGSGKSTLVDIMLGLLEYSVGSVLLDGMPLTPSNAREWQAKLGYVPQNIHLVDSTLAENIAFGVAVTDIDRERVWNVLADAQLADFVRDELPEGLDTLVGERGARLSGGQRQRIGIARALYRNPEVLVLDEATSALDGVTEHALIETIRTFSQKMTIIMIAHRLTSLRYCDNIFLIEHGKIVDSGSYDYMCDHNKYFATTLSA